MIEISIPKEEDILKIINVRNETYRYSFKNLMSKNDLDNLKIEDKHINFFRSALKSKDFIIYIAKMNSEIVGYISGSKNIGNLNNGYEAEVADFYILPKFQAKTSANKKLLIAFLRALKEDNVKSLSFFCLQGNKIEQVYQKIGAKKIKEITLNYKNNNNGFCKSNQYGIKDISIFNKFKINIS